MSNTLSTEKPTDQPQREQDSRALPCSLVLYSGEGTITVTRHADGKATIEMFDQRTIRDLIDKEDRIKLAEFLSENDQTEGPAESQLSQPE